MGRGGPGDPLLVFGDASGGKISGESRFRRVGVATVTFDCVFPLSIRSSAFGRLPGCRQSVPRGELLAFELALRTTVGHICYATDNESVIRGFYG
eukprot:2421821-Pyramimonas_sp.AAC.1